MTQGQMASNPISQAAAVETRPDCAGKVGASLTDLTCGFTLHLRRAVAVCSLLGFSLGS